MRGRRGATETAALSEGAVVASVVGIIPVEFRPRRWRLLTGELLMGVAAVCVWITAWAILAAADFFSWLGPAGWFDYLYMGSLFVAISLFSGMRSGRWVEIGAVRVSGISVNGPKSLWVGIPSRETIALAELDRVRSSRRSMYQRHFGHQYLYSNKDKQIRIRRWAFDPEDLREMLALLGVEREDATVALAEGPLTKHESRDR